MAEAGSGIPIVHLTARALRFLRRPYASYEDVPASVAACTGTLVIPPIVGLHAIETILACGGAVNPPTCPKCAVLWDEALEKRQ